MAEDRWDVFISYARKDGYATARRLYADLTQSGFDLWWDKGGGIPYGSDFTVEIEGGIANSDYLVVLLTPAAVRPDGFVRKEIGYALQHGKRVIPVMLLDCIPPIQIANANYIDMRVNYSRALAALVEVCQGGPDEGDMWRTDGEPPYSEPFLFVGRGHILETIEQSINRLERDGGEFRLILGEPGVGKTGLLRAVHRLADQKGCLTLFADFAYSGPSAVDHDPVSSVVRSLWAQLVAFSEQARHYYQQIDPDHADSPLIWLRDALKQVSSNQPIVLCLDNLHLDTLDVFATWLRQLVACPVLVVASHLSDSFTNPLEGVSASRIKLSPLQPYELSYLFSPTELDHGRRLFELSGGLPSTVWTILTIWTMDGITEKRPDGFTLHDASQLLPDVWETQIEDRLKYALAQAGLQDEYSFEEALDWLTCAAIEGEVFTEEALKQVMSEDVEPEHTTQLLRHLAEQDNPILTLAEPSLPIASTYWRFVPPGLAELLRREAHPEDVAFYGSRLFEVLEKLAHPYPFGIRHHLVRLATQSLEAVKENLEQEQRLPPESVQEGLLQSSILQQLRRYRGYLDREQRISQLRMLISITPETDYARRWRLMRRLGLTLQDYEHNDEVVSAFCEARRCAALAGEDSVEIAQLFVQEAQVSSPIRRLELLDHACDCLPNGSCSKSAESLVKLANSEFRLARVVADIKLEFASTWELLGVSHNALKYSEQTLPVWRALGIRKGEVAALRIIATAWGSMGNPRKTLESYEEVLRLSVASEDPELEAAALISIGMTWSKLGDYEKALEYYERALPKSQEVGYRRGEASTKLEIGVAWYHLQEPRKAITYYEQALELSQAIGDGGIERSARLRLVEAWHLLGDAHKSVENALSSNVSKWQVEDGKKRGHVIYEITPSIWSNRGEKREMPGYFEQILPVLRKMGDRENEVTALFNLAHMYHRLYADFDAAIECLEQCIDIGKGIEGSIHNLDQIRGYLEQVKKEREAVSTSRSSTE